LCSEAETIEELSLADATIASGEMYSPDVLAALPRLRVIARCGVGYDRVDVPAATARDVVLTITPKTNREAVAELALALMLGVAKALVINDRHVRAGRWPRKLLLPLRGTTLGIFGLGRIGSSLAVRAIALGMRVIATESAPDRDFARAHGIELVDFETLLATSDFLSIHCPLTDQTRGLFDRAVFARMKTGSTLINTSRGRVLVESDLVAALQSGHLGGAGLDVYEQEPPDPANPLFQLNNVVLSPHLAGTDETSLAGMALEAAECIVQLRQGQWPAGAVINEQLRTTWRWSR
jgi:phosphoglycerate dehydrogenase-like enzyme